MPMVFRLCLIYDEVNRIMNYFVSGRKPTQEEFIKRLNDFDKDIICLDTYINLRTPIWFLHKPTNIKFLRSPASLFKRLGFPYSTKASNGEIIIGINNINATHPEIAKLLLDPKDGTNYSYGTNTKLKFKCPQCGGLIESIPNNLFNEANNIRCPHCSDGFSFPEKVVINILQQLNVEYKYQLSSSTFSWCENYRYDFYIPILNMIIEVNGLQHYKEKGWSQSLTEIQTIDKLKKELALNNGIDKYLYIDAKYSECEYLKISIINVLSKYFDLNNIDWDLCFKNAGKSKLIMVAEAWKKYHDISPIVNEFKLSRSTILRYLHKCRKLNYIEKDFDQYIENQKKKNGNYHGNKKVICIETGEIFESVRSAEKKYSLNYNKNNSNISSVINGRQHTAYGYHWKYV